MSQTNIEVDNKKAILLGAVIILLQMGFYYIIWMNPFINDISIQFATHPSVKPFEYFGGVDNWMQLRMLFLVIMLAIFIRLFLLIYSTLPGSYLIKGLCFGLILGVIKVIPGAFDTWTLIVYPNELILLQLINGLIGYLFFGAMVSIVYEKFNVIRINH